jgi:hypothetical protein
VVLDVFANHDVAPDVAVAIPDAPSASDIALDLGAVVLLDAAPDLASAQPDAPVAPDLAPILVADSGLEAGPEPEPELEPGPEPGSETGPEPPPDAGAPDVPDSSIDGSADGGIGAVGFMQISAGEKHTCAVASDGIVVCWGANPEGQSTPPAGAFAQVSAGMYVTCGLRADDTAACWGSNWWGESSPPSGTFTQLSTGVAHTCGIKTDGTVACWGSNSAGESTPVDGLYTQVSAGAGHTCALKTDYTVACWGRNDYGQASPLSGTFAQISVGGYHTCGLRGDGSAECWGLNDHGQSTPTSGVFSAIDGGGWHTCGLRSSGSVDCWGDDESGQSTPAAGAFTQISAGGSHSCGLRGDGTVSCWGMNDVGQATPPAIPVPLQIFRDGTGIRLTWDSVAYPSPRILVRTGDGTGMFNADFGGYWKPHMDASIASEFDTSQYASGVLLHSAASHPEAYYAAFTPTGALPTAVVGSLPVGKFDVTSTEGYNMLSSPFVPADPAIGAVLGTDFTAYIALGGADLVVEWIAGGDGLVNLAFLHTDGTWHDGSQIDQPSQITLDATDGFYTRLGVGHVSRTTTLVGAVRTRSYSMVVLADRNLVSTNYPVAVPLADSGLAASGAAAGSTVDESCKIETYRTDQTLDKQVWLRNDGKWIDAASGLESSLELEPGKGYYVVDPVGFTWAYPIPY